MSRVFPAQFDNVYRGHWAGLVVLAVVAAFKALQGALSLVIPAQTMAGADGFPLSSFDQVAAGYAVYMFALLGMYLLIVPLQSLLVLLWYRSMVPVMFLWLAVVQLVPRAVHALYPPTTNVVSAGHAVGFYVNLVLIGLTIIGFGLSVVRRGGHQSA